MADKYHIKLDKFEGPLELLLELIEKEEMDITELSLSKVADEYLEHIKNNENIHLENLAEFLSVASRLLLIKSRALLPLLKFTEEEEEEIKDLTLQLEEYKKFKEASKKLAELAAAGKIAHSREAYGGIGNVFFPPEDVNIYDLKKYFERIISEIPVIEKLEEEILSEVMTLEEKINELETVIRGKIETSFSALTEKAQDKIEVIVTFLAMLEMIKQRMVQVEQEDLFREIKLSFKNAQS